MQGKISQWNDKRGFGFIESQELDNKIFFHISSIEDRGHRPSVTENVEFVVAKDKDDRVKADKVRISGLPSNKYNRTVNPYIRVIPAKLTHFDYLIILIGLCSIIYMGIDIYRSGNVLGAWPYAIPAAVAHLLFYRPRKPQQSHFTCARCKTASEFNIRTVKAWKRGMMRFFCERCHELWRSNRVEPSAATDQPKGRQGHSVCVLAITLSSIFTIAIAYLWFA
jgi:cold shock CspA family protein